MSRIMTNIPWRKVGFAGLGVAALAAFYGAVRSSIFWPAWLHEFAKWSFAAIVFGRLAYVLVLGWYRSNGSGRTAVPARSVYSVPRQFGLGTLFMLTFVFGLLSASVNWLEIPPAYVIFVLAFVCLVGLLQFVLDRAPRHASMLAGSLFFPLVIGLWLLNSHTNYFASSLPSTWAFHAACWSV